MTSQPLSRAPTGAPGAAAAERDIESRPASGLEAARGPEAAGGPHVPARADLPWGYRAAAQGMVALAAGIGTVNLAAMLPAAGVPLRSLAACTVGWGAASAAGYFAAGHVWAPRVLGRELSAASVAAGTAVGAFLTAAVGDRTHTAGMMLLKGLAAASLAAFSAGSMRYHAELLRGGPRPTLVAASVPIVLHALDFVLCSVANVDLLFTAAGQMQAPREAFLGLPSSPAAQRGYAAAALSVFGAGLALMVHGVAVKSAASSTCGAFLTTWAGLPLALCALATGQSSR